MVTKTTLKRAARTFIQAAFGYVVANIGAYLAGVDFGDKDALTSAGVGLAVCALSAGLATLMNIESEDSKNEQN